TRPASSFWSSVSVPPASVLGFVAPVEGCWPDGAPEPSVLVAPVEGCWPACRPEPSVLVAPVEGCWPACRPEPSELVAPVEGCWPGCRPEPSVLVAPVEGCWPDGAPEPSVLVAPVEGCWPACRPEPSELSVVSVPPFFGFFAPVEGCWLVSVLFAAESLEPASATATAPPEPISRPAASTQTPAASRKCDRTTICPRLESATGPTFANSGIVRPFGVGL